MRVSLLALYPRWKVLELGLQEDLFLLLQHGSQITRILISYTRLSANRAVIILSLFRILYYKIFRLSVLDIRLELYVQVYFYFYYTTVLVSQRVRCTRYIRHVQQARRARGYVRYARCVWFARYTRCPRYARCVIRQILLL